jgi:hypothetical protein
MLEFDNGSYLNSSHQERKEAYMFTPETSRHFERYAHPETGVVSYLLKNETAPLQKLVYYVSKNTSLDERYCWIVCAHPPGGWMEGSAFTAACIDFKTDEIYYHPDIPGYGSCIDPDTGELYYHTGNLILKKGPLPDSPVTKIARVPAEWRVFPGRMATHLTFSADKTKLCCDIGSGNDVYITSLDIKAGEFELWHKLHGGWNHAQFNPVDNDLILFAMEFWQDMKTGVHHIIPYNDEGKRTRSWTIRRGEEPVLHLPLHSECSHEWWSANGRYIYYCDGKNGVGKIDYYTGEHSMFYTPINSHAHSSADDMFLCADKFSLDDGQPFYRGCATKTAFHNLASGKSIMMMENPAHYQPEEPCAYHIDPHPRFVFNDKYIAQVTTLPGPGKVTVAFTNVEHLKEMTK